MSDDLRRIRAALYQAALLEGDRILRDRELDEAELAQLVETLERIRVALAGDDRPYRDAFAAHGRPE